MQTDTKTMNKDTRDTLRYYIDLTDGSCYKHTIARNKIYKELLKNPKKAILYIKYEHESIKNICRNIIEDISNAIN